MPAKKILLSEYQTLRAKEQLQSINQSRKLHQSVSKISNVSTRRNLSSSALRSKSEVEQLTAWKKKYYLEDPFMKTQRESDYLPIK